MATETNTPANDETGIATIASASNIFLRELKTSMTCSSPVVESSLSRIAAPPAEERFSRPQIVRHLALFRYGRIPEKFVAQKKSTGILEQFQGRRKRCKDGPHSPYDVAYDANLQLKERLLFSIGLEPAVELPGRLGPGRRSIALRKPFEAAMREAIEWGEEQKLFGRPRVSNVMISGTSSFFLRSATRIFAGSVSEVF
ncbi:MAG: hypothetical protein ACYCOX_09825 [Acidobacteriaceae bacterium]